MITNRLRREVTVADLKESLEEMREMVLSRIRMLQDGTTFYDEAKKSHYLGEYRSRLRDLDLQLLSLSLGGRHPRP